MQPNTEQESGRKTRAGAFSAAGLLPLQTHGLPKGGIPPRPGFFGRRTEDSRTAGVSPVAPWSWTPGTCPTLPVPHAPCPLPPAPCRGALTGLQGGSPAPRGAVPGRRGGRRSRRLLPGRPSARDGENGQPLGVLDVAEEILGVAQVVLQPPQVPVVVAERAAQLAA